MKRDPFAEFEEVQPVSQGGGLYRIPDPKGDRGEQRAEEDQSLQTRKADIDIGNTGFTQRDKLRSDYNALPAIKEYRVAVQSLAAALRRGDDGSGDTALIYDYVKALDPTSVVREAEVGMAASGASSIEAAAARLKKEFGIEGGGNLPPQVRNRLRREIINSVVPRVQQYNQQRAQYEELAKRNGFDPYEIVGNHDADPYVPLFREYDRRNGLGEREGQVGAAAARGGFNPGSGRTTALAGDLAEDDVGTGYRLPTELEQQFMGFVQSRGPNLTVDDTAQWFMQNVPGSEITPEWRDRMGAYVDAVREGRDVASGLDYSLTDEAQMMRLEQRALESGDRERGSGGTMQSINAFGRGAGDVATVGFLDEIGGAFDTIVDGGTMEDNLAYHRYLNARDAETNPYARLAGQVVGGLAVPLGRLRAGSMTAGQMAKEGAAFGGAYGFGSAEGDLGDRLVGGAAGAGGGAVVGAGLGAGLRAVAPKISGALANRAAAKGARNQEAQAFAEAALRNPDVPVMRADVPGATGQQIVTALAERTLAGGKVTRARDAGTAALGNTADDVASRFGPVASERSIAGEAAQSGAKSFVDASQTRVGKMYDAIPIDPAAPSNLDGTRTALAELNSRFSSNPQIAAALKDNRLATYERALSEGGLSWQDLKEFRSTVGEIIDGPVLSEGTSRKAMRRLYGALSDDMEATAAAQGPKALAAFKRANAAAKERFDTIDSVITPILGNDGSKSATSAFERIQSWAQDKGGDPVRLARLIRSMPPDDAGVVRATIIASLGKATPGAQNAAADLFSPSTFVSNWAKLGDRAKGILFDGEHRQALDDIATLAGGMKEGRRFANTSETTRGTMALATVGSIGTAIGAGNPLGLLMAGAGAGGQVMLSRVMANPRSAKWLAALAKKPNPQAQRAHIQRLDAIARSEPLIANDILGLQQRLLEAFGTQPTRLAAENQDVEERGGVQRKNEGQSDER